MSEYLSAEDLANDINMCRTGFSGTIVVIEGETDQTVFERFFDLDACLFLPANSKDNAIQAFEFLGEQEQEGVIVIVDADFDHLVKNAAHAESIFLTDFHDLDIMMIECPALEIVLRQYASPGKIQMVRKARGGASVRRILYDAVLPLGILRLVSKRML